ncbi:Lipocalin-like domain-containing protein [Sphingomonas laterariae]|uniref:Lipocalin-like domain-containing protein n=1 Tax=Edaphosphingomonas laterariae TaxID=861865 RepID=A0A239HJ07_9SPHN|nr:lipocalin-like domain-containing protein [Sphingomonas laterariae]SNS81389.1 Lipocalin-like domain-containing protein [Sphingomonas laterariae]
MTEADVKLRNALLGAWELVLWTNRRPDDVIEHPFGDHPRGVIIYAPDGHMSVHMLRPGIAPFGTPPAATPPERVIDAYHGYVGYFGRFTVDAAHSIVTHHIDGAWYPDIQGDQVRHCRLDGDRLFLEAETPTGWVTIEWRRAPAR